MIYSGDLLKINGINVIGVSSYKVSRSKLWKNAERNMKGDVRATLIGVFPKITAMTRVTTEDEISQLISLFDSDFFNLTWFDAKTHTTRTASYYASDYEYELLSKKRGLYKPFTVTFVPVSKV